MNPDCSLEILASQNQQVVGRVSTRHVGINPDLRFNGLFGMKQVQERFMHAHGMIALSILWVPGACLFFSAISIGLCSIGVSAKRISA